MFSMISRSLLRPFSRRIRSILGTKQTYDVCHIEEVESASKPVILMDGLHVPTPETAWMNIDPFAGYLKAAEYWAPTVRSIELTDMLFCPLNNCVITNDRCVIAESTGPGARAEELNSRSFLSKQEIHDVEGVWTALRCPYNNYYHFLIDNLSRFDLLHHPHFGKYSEINVFCPGGLSDVESFFLHRLCPRNVNLVPVETGVLYRPECYIFNSFVTARASGYIRKPYIKRIRKTCANESFEACKTALEPRLLQRQRIYITRSRAKTRRVLNEKALVSTLESLGFNIYELEHLAPEEQVCLFRDAECVVAPHGAGLANLLFSSSTEVLELFGSRHVVPHYYLLSKSLGHSYRYICGHSSDSDSDLRVNVDQVRALLLKQLEHDNKSCTYP